MSNVKRLAMVMFGVVVGVIALGIHELLLLALFCFVIGVVGSTFRGGDR